MNEFDMISQYFSPLAGDGSLDFKDDAAVLKIPDGHELVVTSDTLNAGIHFFEDQGSADIAAKSLLVNISDLMAMGARPFCYQLNIAFPDKPLESWLKSFCEDLLNAQKRYGMFCSGGDTTRIDGPLSISITAMGLVEVGTAVQRRGATPGDVIILSDPIGDAYVGYNILHNANSKGMSFDTVVEDTRGFPSCIQAYLRPDIPTTLYEAVTKYAHASCDISDGLLADLGHLCHASECDAAIRVRDIQFSQDVQRAIEGGIVEKTALLHGGDDYKIVMAVHPDHQDAALKSLRDLGCAPQVIGAFQGGQGQVQLYDETGRLVDLKHTGWSHF